MTGWPIIAAMALPLVGAVGIALAGQRQPNLREAITLVTAAALITVVWGFFPDISAGEKAGIQFSEMVPGISLAFRVEPLGMIFAMLASLLWFVNSIYSIGYMRGNNEKKQTQFYVSFAIALSATMGIAFSDNLLTLFLFYEILTLSTYPLVSHKGDKNTIASARVYLGVLLVTSIGLFLPAIIWTYQAAGSLTFTDGGVFAGQLGGLELGILLGLFVLGIGKAAVMPVHRWLPAAMVAPTPVSALLHAVAVVKAGVFSITKIVVYIFGIDQLAGNDGATLFLSLAAFTIIVGSIVALRQTNLKRLLAYSTIAQLSYIVMAALILHPIAGIGAAVHMVAHAFGKISLFFAAGAIYTASKKTELAQLKGIGRRMPWTMTAFTIGALSMIGLPPTAGFISKWYILGGALASENAIAIIAIIASTLLNAAYFLPILHAAWLQEDNTPADNDHGEAPLPILIATMTTASLTILFFFYQGPVVDLATQMMGLSTDE